LRSLDEAAHQIRVASVYLAKPYMRSADALSYCEWLIFSIQVMEWRTGEIQHSR
jgi:hypothetical protein